MLSLAASPPDKGGGRPVEMERRMTWIQKVRNTVEAPQDQFIDRVPECTPVDLGPAMAGRRGRRGVLEYTHTSTPLKHSTSPLDDTTNATHARTSWRSAAESSFNSRQPRARGGLLTGGTETGTVHDP